MSDAPERSKTPRRPVESTPAELNPEIAARIRAALIHGPGLQEVDGLPRTRKSASPRQRTRQESIAHASPPSMQRMESIYRQVASEKVSLRQGDAVKDISIREALARAHVKTALAGNARALADVSREIARADAREAAIVADENQFWRSYRDAGLAEIAEAERLGRPEPRLLPHPDDIVITAGKPVRFIGPTDEAGLKRTEETRQMRDQMILWQELDERERGLRSKKLPEERQSGAGLYLHVFQKSLPARMRLSDVELSLRMDKARGMSMRVLLKMLHAGWRALGRSAKRGVLPPTFEVAKQQFKTAQGFIEAIESGEIDVEKLASGSIDEDARDVLERIGMLQAEG